MQTQRPNEKAVAEKKITDSLKKVVGLAEAYPELKADKLFLEIMANMKELEDNIEHARRYYNGSVLDYNVACEVFPMNMVASAFSFLPAEFFTLENEEEEKQNVKANYT